jgi:hypothetical protein
MKPTQEQVIAWAREAGWYEAQSHDDCPACGVFDINAALNLAYEAGRKDENEACAKAAEQIEQEPVAWMHDMGDVVDLNVSGRGIPLYFAPPQREWQGLTDEEIMKILDYGQYGNVPQYARNFVDAIEAKLREKNND